VIEVLLASCSTSPVGLKVEARTTSENRSTALLLSTSRSKPTSTGEVPSAVNVRTPAALAFVTAVTDTPVMSLIVPAGIVRNELD
jgi:esterase/lipase superfamily enzyme